jgi:glycosyltransferase involved in cell wall biosynthesis
MTGPGPTSAPDRRLRVLQVIKCLGYGGAERLVIDMARHRDRDRFDYEAAYVLAAEDTLVPALRDDGVPVHCLGATSNTDLSWTRRLRSVLVAGRFDVVHTHLPYAATLSRLVVASLPRAQRPAVVYTEHNMWDKMAVALKFLNRATIGLDDRLVVVSEAARRSLPPRLRRRAVVVIHGVDLTAARAALAERDSLRGDVRRELGLRDGELLALTVANLRPEKAYDVLLRAAALTVAEALPVRFAAVGRGPLRDELTERHERLGLDAHFRFLGPRQDVWRLLAGADLFVLPSRQEGMPVAVMEAASMALPLVLSAVGDLPQLFSDGVDAVVVPPEQPDALAAAIGRLATDDGLRARLSRAAAARSELFDVASATRTVEGIYDELVAARR